MRYCCKDIEYFQCLLKKSIRFSFKAYISSILARSKHRFSSILRLARSTVLDFNAIRHNDVSSLVSNHQRFMSTAKFS